MRKPIHRALRLKPLASCLALALTMAAGSTQAVPGTHQPRIAPPTTGQLMLREAMSNGDARYIGWRPSLLPEQRGSEPIIDAWRARQPEYVPFARQAGRGGVNRVVTNCNDAGGGSLRATIDIANSGDTIDLTQLACSTITLTTGELVIADADIDIVGPGASQMAISGGNNSAVLVHTGLGTLTLEGVAITDGSKYLDSGASTGGCITSLGSVSLFNSEVTSCLLLSTASDGRVAGGGIYAQGDVILSNSLVSGNAAINKYTSGISSIDQTQGGAPRAYGGGISAVGAVTVVSSLVIGNSANSESSGSYGGGIEAGGGLLVKYSQIANNSAGNGGGLGARGSESITITRSTISGNQAAIGGGAYLSADGAATSVVVNSSTFSGNVATAKYAGLMIGGTDSDKTIHNSTITRNLSESVAIGAGLQLFSGAIVDMRSTIVSGNNVDDGGGPEPSDIGRTGDTGGLLFSGPIKENLVLQSTTPLPPSTEIGLPKVTSLRDNGGPTPTHALRGNSLALQNGTNNLDQTTDQRGTGFARVIGGLTDVGAVEFNLDDLVFADDYDDEGN